MLSFQHQAIQHRPGRDLSAASWPQARGKLVLHRVLWTWERPWPGHWFTQLLLDAFSPESPFLHRNLGGPAKDRLAGKGWGKHSPTIGLWKTDASSSLCGPRPAKLGARKTAEPPLTCLWQLPQASGPARRGTCRERQISHRVCVGSMFQVGGPSVAASVGSRPAPE